MLSPAEFRRRLLIDRNGEAVVFDAALDPWQRRDSEALDDGWLRAIGANAGHGKSRAYLERPRGHGKTTELAAMCAWALYAVPHVVRGVGASGDKDQARLLRDGMQVLCSRNPWLNDAISIQNYRAVNRKTGSSLEILSSDAATSYGLTPDFIVCDELTHWKKPDLWHSLISSAAKRNDCMVVVISNAGMGQGTSWQWDVREKCREDQDWYFSRLDGPKASWINEALLDEQRRMLPGKAFNRLWMNLWSPETGDALNAADIEAAITLDGPTPTIHDGWFPYVAGLDLGLKRDHAALVVLAVDVQAARLKLMECRSWAPSGPRNEIQLAEVEAAVLDAHHRYQLSVCCYDPWQAARSAQWLSGQGVPMAEISATPQNLNRMATHLLQVFSHGQIDLYREPALIRDLCRLTIVERTGGFKIEAMRDEHGHCDRATALVLAIPVAVQFQIELAMGMH